MRRVVLQFLQIIVSQRVLSYSVSVVIHKSSSNAGEFSGRFQRQLFQPTSRGKRCTGR